MNAINLHIVREVTSEKIYHKLKRCYLEIVPIAESNHLHIHSPLSLFPELVADYKQLKKVSKLYNCIDIHLFHVVDSFEYKKTSLDTGSEEYLELCYLLEYK